MKKKISALLEEKKFFEKKWHELMKKNEEKMDQMESARLMKILNEIDEKIFHENFS